MARILMVSKPIAPPWNDGSKNLVRSLATRLERHEATVLTSRGAAPGLPNVRAEAVYRRARAGFAPALRDNAAVFSRLVFGEAHPLWHFFFAPNRRSAQAGRAASRLRRVRTVHTVASAPRSCDDLEGKLFADRVVVLSNHTEQRFRAAGIADERLCRIAPAVEPVDSVASELVTRMRHSFGASAGDAVIVYPGDLEFSHGAERTIRAHAALPPSLAAILVMACRPKTAAAAGRERELRELAQRLGSESRVRWLGETREIHALLQAADLVAMPSEDLYAKVDYPIVLLEAMSLGRAVLVVEGTPAAELAQGGAAIVCTSDVEAVRAAFESALCDESLRADVGVRACNAVRERYHPSRMARAYEDLYDNLLQ